jgi:CHAD domain-containing protein
MALAPNNIEKPLDKLRKSLKKIRKRPTPDEVHDLRTNSRRVEATLHALMLDQKRRGRRILKAVTPLRKRAGSVRDMDVLTGFASTLSEDGNNQCLVQLLEHLGETRFQGARALRRSVKKRKQIAGKRLKRCSRYIVDNLSGSKKRQREWMTDSAAVALQLSGELAKWPRLTRDNLHPFRLKVKELRNVVRLSADSGELVKVLGDVKDSIGEWHDWMELSGNGRKGLKGLQ